MTYKNILVEVDGPVAVVTINREKQLNALDDETIAELDSCFAELETDENVRVVILTGAGQKSFVAGADIGELNRCDLLSGYAKVDRGQALMFKMENSQKIFIAAINGFALGGGCEIAMACDIRLASDNAKLGQPEVNLGIIPGYGGTQRLPRLVGSGKAMQMILTGDFVRAEEAKAIGLVEEVYPQEELLDRAREMAQKIASKGPLAIVAAKRSIYAGLDVDIKRGCEYERIEFGAICTTEDKTEGTGAFLEKRKPDFKGR